MRENQLILHDNLVIFHFLGDGFRKFDSIVLAVAKMNEEKPDVVNLWHQFPINANTRWWVIVIGKLMYR